MDSRQPPTNADMSPPTSLSDPGLVLPLLLANQTGVPSALRLKPSGAVDWAGAGWLGDLLAAAPCVVFTPDLAPAPEAAAQLQTLGVTVLGPEALLDNPNTMPDPKPGTPPWMTGHWYLHIPPKPHAAQAASRQRAMALMQLVAQDADTHELEEVLRQDAGLAYQLLRLVNSPAIGVRREVTSFSQALLMLGRQQLKRWLNLLLFAAREDDPRSAMLMAHVVLRARGMELLAQHAGLDKAAQEQAFMAGMFSMLGVLLGQPLPDILRPIRITDELRDALLEQKGPIGQLLRHWTAIESGDDALVRQTLHALGLTPATATPLLAEAAAWMFKLIRGSDGHGHAG